MKYMGSKTAMLENGLGELVVEHAEHSKRVVDLFTGSAAIAWFAAERTTRPVVAFDLQTYAVVLARAVITRTRGVDTSRLETTWIAPVTRRRKKLARWKQWPELNGRIWKKNVVHARRVCADEAGGVTWSAYGGHYFSPHQATTIDCLLESLPEREPDRSVCLAALIVAASRCAASPGHTAQPFAPTDGGLTAIYDAWKVDPLEAARAALKSIAPQHAKSKGLAEVADAVEKAGTLEEGDLAIVDPPYSAVQYSRFYHVLETIALQSDFTAEGVGRYPPFTDRPHSDFSLLTASSGAVGNLFENLASAGVKTIVTFPRTRSSNGLSGSDVKELADPHFVVESSRVRTRFSTLGGNHDHRPPRQRREELILVLNPR